MAHDTNTQWNDWQWQLQNAVRSAEDLPAGLVDPVDFEAVEAAADRWPMVISPYYLSLFNGRSGRDPIRRMAVPSPEELHPTPHLSWDPIAEQSHCPVPGVIRRYPDRALLLVSGRCAVNCRHCTRRSLNRGSLRPLGPGELKAAYDYLRDHTEIGDVILSGGDPLLLEDDQLFEILTDLRSIPSVRIIRLATRVPVTLPMRITPALVAGLRPFHPIYVNTQFNHPAEITDASRRAAIALADGGMPLANQAVLLAGINDSAETIEMLSRGLLEMRVRPYYLFLCDLWQGLEHLRTPLSTGLAIVEHLRGRLSGLGIPQLIADLPGGIGKVPIGPQHIVSVENGVTTLRAPDGRLAGYPDPTPSIYIPRGCAPVRPRD